MTVAAVGLALWVVGFLFFLALVHGADTKDNDAGRVDDGPHGKEERW